MNKKTQNTITPVSLFLRGGAATIDIFIVGMLRILFMQIVGSLWVNGQLIKFYEDFNNKFGVPFSAINEEHVLFLSNHAIVKVMLLFLFLIILVGAIYHAYLNSSSWSATIGKRICGLLLVKNEGKALSFWQAFWHYTLSLVPWIFMIYILLYQAKEQTTLYNALTGNLFNLTLGLATVVWIQIHIITKKKNTIHDLIVGCTMVKGKIGQGFPKIRSK